MSATPRLRSAFPQTPQTRRKRQDDDTPVKAVARPVKELKSLPTPSSHKDAPLIPFEVIDAPSQRLYVVAIYVALNAWRLIEGSRAVDELDSTWLFLKWIFVDGLFLFGLQILRIPWLEWAFPTTLAVFLLHAAANVFLMFRIPLPLGTWIAGMVKVAYDRELSISERKVKPADILHNASLILGKQIVHILPEGSASLNPDRIPLCIDSARSSVTLPIRINQTNPIAIELLRFDLSTGENETVVIPSKQLKQLKRQADKRRTASDAEIHRDLLLPVKKTGIYRLQKVVDESKLEVRTRSLNSLVASCPKAHIKNTQTHKCRGELSDLMLEVEGIPPLKIKYSRKVNQLDRGFSFQSIQPENSHSSVVKSEDTPTQHPVLDLSWAHSQKIEVPLNESLNVYGQWFYAIEEVHDAYGNVANYSHLDEADRPLTKTAPQWHQFSVHERPRISLHGCNEQRPLEVAKDETVELPIQFHASGEAYGQDAPFTLAYSFNQADAENDEQPTKSRQVSLRNLAHKPRIRDPGWYSLKAISSQFCSGEVLEPSSCLLHNPPEPELTVRHEKVFDKCANNAVGIVADLDLVGSPPFRLRYNIESSKGVETRLQTIDSLRGRLELTPSEAGHYKYRFLDIADSVYEPRSLKDKVPVLEQDVKPPASAHIVGSKQVRKACFGEPISVDVSFIGESPWNLEYEVVHNGRKTKHVLKSESEMATIVTDKLVSGGAYTLALTSVKDKSNCKRVLKDEIKIEARSKKPHVAFGQIDRARNVQALEDATVELPVRLGGEGPWHIKYKNIAAESSPVMEKTLWNENSVISVREEGRYELLEVMDASCTGTVEQSAKVFDVSWIPRPSITAVDGSPAHDGPIAKRDVCEGDTDALELRFSGSPPYSLRYEQQRKSQAGGSSARVKTLRSALNLATVELDTKEAGYYTYKFTEISDSLYDQGKKGRDPLVVTQRVNPLPSARFESPGHIYGFCKEEADGEESIPVILEGTPPFSMEILIKHHSSAKPEVVSIANINSNRHNLPIPRRHLDLGQHVVSIHKVRDARGCQRITEFDASSVRVAVSDVPTIIPLESQVDYCVGERISFSLSGHAPFEVFYTFDGAQKKATSHSTNFRRIAEKPGQFTVTAVSDGASGKCKAHKNITKVIHEMPSVRISKGRVSVIDIHEGGEADLNFEFWGTPPFEFTYTRSSNPQRGKKSQILDIKHDISYEHTKTIKASDEGTYEVVAIKDKFCSFSKQEGAGKPGWGGKQLQKSKK
ncbi:hypothetical protein DTO212C5_80 [Paecilomyces variotii]|nr:hypothetical protein DTO212C5_80 [Paecilomyces variotii]